MKATALSSLLLMLIMGIIAVSCSDEHLIINPTSNNPLYSMGFGGTGDTCIGLVEAYEQAITYLADSVTLVSDTSFQASAVFIDSNTYETILAGTVSINGISIPPESMGYSYYNDTLSAFASGGSPNIFSISGAGLIAAASDTVNSPTSSTVISYPTPYDTVDASSGMTVTWNSGGADTAHIWITGLDTAGVACVIRRTVPNSGSSYISPSELSIFAPGELAVGVGRINYRRHMHPGGRAIFFLVHSDNIVYAHID